MGRKASFILGLALAFGAATADAAPSLVTLEQSPSLIAFARWFTPGPRDLADPEAWNYLAPEIKGAIHVLEATYGFRAIHRAAWQGHDVILRLLLSSNAGNDVTDHVGDTPLILAAHNGQLATARALIEAGSDVNHAGMMGATPMFACSLAKIMPVVPML